MMDIESMKGRLAEGLDRREIAALIEEIERLQKAHAEAERTVERLQGELRDVLEFLESAGYGEYPATVRVRLVMAGRGAPDAH